MGRRHANLEPWWRCQFGSKHRRLSFVSIILIGHRDKHFLGHQPASLPGRHVSRTVVYGQRETQRLAGTTPQIASPSVDCALHIHTFERSVLEARRCHVILVSGRASVAKAAYPVPVTYHTGRRADWGSRKGWPVVVFVGQFESICQDCSDL